MYLVSLWLRWCSILILLVRDVESGHRESRCSPFLLGNSSSKYYQTRSDICPFVKGFSCSCSVSLSVLSVLSVLLCSVFFSWTFSGVCLFFCRARASKQNRIWCDGADIWEGKRKCYRAGISKFGYYYGKSRWHFHIVWCLLDKY